MTAESETRVTELLATAKRIAQKEFGEQAAQRPEVVTAILQGLAAMEQVQAMDQLGNSICAAADHARG